MHFWGPNGKFVGLPEPECFQMRSWNSTRASTNITRKMFNCKKCVCGFNSDPWLSLGRDKFGSIADSWPRPTYCFGMHVLNRCLGSGSRPICARNTRLDPCFGLWFHFFCETNCCEPNVDPWLGLGPGRHCSPKTIVAKTNPLNAHSPANKTNKNVSGAARNAGHS